MLLKVLNLGSFKDGDVKIYRIFLCANYIKFGIGKWRVIDFKGVIV